MFGFKSKRARAVEAVELYLGAMFAGLDAETGKQVPVDALSDPYVAGFLDILTTHATATVYQFRMPDEAAQSEMMREALDRIHWGYGAAARSAAIQASHPTHPAHALYRRGQDDGKEHIRTFFTNDGIGRNNIHQKFRDYVRTHYL